MLDERYQLAYEVADTRGCASILGAFDKAVRSSAAVISMALNDLHHFVTSENSLYRNYELGVERQLRKPAYSYYDRERRGVGGMLFGSYANEITYAALSLDHRGPISYGPYSLKLRDIAIRNRATILQENSYTFRRRFNIQPGDRNPLGFTSTWDNRNKVAVAKAVEWLTPSLTARDFAVMLLNDSGNRATDEFVEVQIYGTFDLNAVESIKANRLATPEEDRELLQIVKTHLKHLGKEWIEY